MLVFEAGAEGQSLDMPSLSAEDLIMAMHKASSRRVEVLSRTTGNVDQVRQAARTRVLVHCV